jgi:WS/DGAT/MGAT family acyltransferase
VWLVEGLEDDRWAIISKVHHCMIDGVAGTDLMQLMFDVDPDASHPEPREWTPQRDPSDLGLVAGALTETVTSPLRRFTSLPGTGELTRTAKGLLGSGRSLATALPQLARQAATPLARTLTGPIGPHRRWAWTDAQLDEFKQVRAALGGSLNDVVLTAVTRGFRDLLQGRGALSEDVVVRSMVPVSVRKPGERGTLNNQVTAVFVDLPVGVRDPAERLARIRRQMDDHKAAMQAVDARSIIAMGDFVAPTLLALGVRAAMQAGQLWCQAVTTNVPGPRIPLYVLGRRMCSTHAYVPIAGGTRVSIGIFSYLNSITFGINADFDAFPDVDVLAGGIRSGIEELLALAGSRPATAAQQ